MSDIFISKDQKVRAGWNLEEPSFYVVFNGNLKEYDTDMFYWNLYECLKSFYESTNKNIDYVLEFVEWQKENDYWGGDCEEEFKEFLQEYKRF